jgi:hypothetical protein
MIAMHSIALRTGRYIDGLEPVLHDSSNDCCTWCATWRPLGKALALESTIALVEQHDPGSLSQSTVCHLGRRASISGYGRLDVLRRNGFGSKA